ncbi:OPT oligopeptide transporter protein-domain-containing protein [Mucidula mucida]|nr:OPT oligopeptide transporter protein-domain-containing protein [Mucidula mucida]
MSTDIDTSFPSLMQELSLICLDSSKPFPVDPYEPEETHQLTVRALIVGCVLGAIVGASNIYLGLKTGFTFGPQLFGAIFGYAILKSISKALPESGLLGRFFGGPFGPKENCTVQRYAASYSLDSSGGLGILFVGAMPAMYRLHLLSEFPQDDFGRLVALTVCAGFFGVFFVIPLRRYYIILQKLVFPTPRLQTTGEVVARKKSLGLLISFAITFVYKVMTGYAPGMIYDWHIGWTLSRIGFTSIIALENYGWWIEFTPAFFGAGMLSGLNASLSFLAPSIVKNGLAFGAQPYPDTFPEIWSYMGLSFDDPDAYSATHRLDTGCCGPVTELADDDEDRTPMEDRIPFSWWSIGVFCSTVMSCAILATKFNMNVGEALLALILGFIFSFIGVQSSGQTDINPVSTVAKASQLIFGGIGKGSGMQLNAAQTFNLSAGVVSGGSAAQASDMTGDLKTGYLLGAKPKNQFIAQLVGSVVAVFLNTGLFILFTKATPCILYLPDDGVCTYGAPSVAAWAAVAVAVSAPKLPVPASSGYTAIGLSIFAMLCVAVKHLWIPKKYWIYMPNWNSVGLGFVVPQVYYPIAMTVGAIFNYIWKKRNPASFDMYMFAVGAGLLAGEGLGGVFQALLAVIGVDGGSGYGTAIGCPAFEFCG